MNKKSFVKVMILSLMIVSFALIQASKTKAGDNIIRPVSIDTLSTAFLPEKCTMDINRIIYFILIPYQ